jgi:hypothetical protein
VSTGKGRDASGVPPLSASGTSRTSRAACVVQLVFLAVRPASLPAASGRALDATRRDRTRASLIRHALQDAP